MIKSMTGYGRGEVVQEHIKITAELKSVNHRYLDISLRVPKKWALFENKIRALLKRQGLQRGKADLYLNCEGLVEEENAVSYNKALAAAYISYVRQIAEEFSLPCGLTAQKVSEYAHVLSLQNKESDGDGDWDLLEETVLLALTQFNESRDLEGGRLRADLSEKLDAMEGLTEDIIRRSPEISEEYRAKLHAKAQELLGSTQVEESRLLTEVALFADKICTDEESVRLKSHIAAVREALEQGGGVGRKLDFIAQEMNREANTILSKAADLTVSNLAIALKTEIEKLREQIQNIE